MSFVTDQVRRIDDLLDRLQLSRPSTPIADDEEAQAFRSELAEDSERIKHLQFLVKLLSPSPSAKSALVPLQIVRTALSQSHLPQLYQSSLETETTSSPDEGASKERGTASHYERELEWLLVSKAATQIYGQLLNVILDHTIPLSYDIDYWDEVLNSYRYTALYSIQTSPLRLWDFGQEVYQDVRQRAGVQGITENVEGSWRQFYALVRDVVKDRSIEDVRRRVVSPLARVRTECRKKREGLKRVRLMNANALGVLLGEGLSNQTMHEKGIAVPSTQGFGTGEADFDARRDKWKGTVVKNIALMDAVLANVNEEGISVDSFDDAVGAATEDDRFYRSAASVASLRPEEAAQRLQTLIEVRLPTYQETFNQQVIVHGRPSRLIRYWFPATLLLLSSGTILRILVNRKEDILTWIREFGVTVRDFWANWVVEPARKIIGTIRHDEGSEISLMSKRSLEGDRESLERMVVDFAIENPENGKLTEAQIADVRQSVREGDLTSVLKAYEKDLRRPFLGAITGNLISALLIQIQKTKVDVDVAMGGVDEMLKRQELLFGFFGLTPGLLVCIGTVRWLNNTFGNRRAARSGRQAGQLLRELRNIDRILTSATPTDFGELLYKDQGLLLCEVHLFRRDALKVMPKQTYRDFLEDVDELVDVRIGVKRQQKVVKRIRWAYAKWLQ